MTPDGRRHLKESTRFLGLTPPALAREILDPALATLVGLCDTMGARSAKEFVKAHGVTTAIEMARHPSKITPEYVAWWNSQRFAWESERPAEEPPRPAVPTLEIVDAVSEARADGSESTSLREPEGAPQ
jgi:hypothetical protein